MAAIDPNAQLNLAKAIVMLVDGSLHSLDVTAQIFKGFGVPVVQRADTIQEAEKIVQHKAIDLIAIDPAIEAGAGYDFIIQLRRSGGPNAFSPVILMCGHVAQIRCVARARHRRQFRGRPSRYRPAVLLQRVLWVARDKRPFVEVGRYIGPDRRFKFEGPPDGSDGRREGDLKAPLGAADEPNMSQDEIDMLYQASASDDMTVVRKFFPRCD